MFDETPDAPPAMAPMESTTRICWVLGGLPSLSIRPASEPTATIVPIVSKKSASSSEKTRTTARITECLNGPSTEKCPSREKSGVETTASGNAGTVERHPAGLPEPPK